VILAGGRIVADGTEEELARRITADAEVRWTREGQRFVHSTPDATAFVRRLLTEPGPEVSDLEVRRATLEDTYIALVRTHEQAAAEVAA
jgi:ABC-2 type transport system ATP-binding protein